MKWLVKLLAAIVVLVVVAMGVLSYYGSELMMWSLKPDHAFDDKAHPAAPNYADAASWAALPSQLNEAAARPPNFVEMALAPADVDVFYVHPTGFLNSQGWNDDLAEGTLTVDQTEAMLTSQASAFNACCKIYAPKYRQATLYAFFDDSGSGHQAFELAYTDVLAAFDYYMATSNKGRPIILASHSQGTLHLMRLMAERFNQGPRREQLIAAYTLGYSMPIDFVDNVLNGLSVCQTATDIHCIIHYDAFSAGESTTRDGPMWYPTGWQYGGNSQPVCVNPLTWGMGDKSATIFLDAGFTYDNIAAQKPADRDASIAAYNEAYAPATCIDGRLEVALPDDSPLNDYKGDDGNLHIFDYSLFWGQIRGNARQRIDAYNQQRSGS